MNIITGVTNGATELTANTWEFLSMVSAIAQGVESNMRIGNRIFVKYIDIVLYFEQDGSPRQNGHSVRYVVVHNKDTAGTIVTGAALFNSGGAESTTSQYDALKLWAKRMQFSLLVDKQHTTFTTTQAAGVGTHTPNGIIQFRVPINKQVNYSTVQASTLVSTNLVNNDFNIGVCSQGDACCTPRVSWRVVFADM